MPRASASNISMRCTVNTTDKSTEARLGFFVIRDLARLFCRKILPLVTFVRTTALKQGGRVTVVTELQICTLNATTKIWKNEHAKAT